MFANRNAQLKNCLCVELDSGIDAYAWCRNSDGSSVLSNSAIDDGYADIKLPMVHMHDALQLDRFPLQFVEKE